MANKRADDRKLLNLIFAILIFFLILRLIASFFPQERLWGLSQAAYISKMPFLYLGLFIIGIFLYIRGNKHPAIIYIYEKSRLYLLFKKIFPYLVVLISGILFYLFSVKAYFLGDGYTLISVLSNQDSIGRSLEIGEFIIHELYLKLFGSFNLHYARLAYKNISILSGLIFVVSLVFYGRKITSSFFSYCGLIFLMLTSAATILYFGYVENYSVTSAVLFLFFISGISSIKNRSKSVIPIVAFLSALLLHKISVVYLPVFLVYIAITFLPKKIVGILSANLRYIMIGLIILFTISYIAVKIWAPLFWKISFMHPYKWEFTVEGYTLFSIKHFIDFLNLLIFLIPISLVVLILAVFLPHNMKRKESSLFSIFIWPGALIGLMSAFIFEPNLGMARDWDLMSIMMIGALVAGIYYWFDKYSGYKFYRTATILLLTINLSIFVPWLALHNSEWRLYDYCMTMIKIEPKRATPGLLNMFRFLEQKGQYYKMNRLKEFQKSHYPEIEFVRKGKQYLEVENYSKAEELFKKAILENPRSYRLYIFLGLTMFRTNRFKETLKYLKIADSVNPDNSMVNYMLGATYYNLEDNKSALKHWHKSINFDVSNYDPYISLGNYFYEKGMPDSAKYYFTRLPLSKYPVGIYYRLGLVELQSGDTTSALSYFDKYMEIGKDTTLMINIKNIKANLR